jgi:hypothetical protein
VAALLHFASSLGFRKLPLSGANIIVSLADGSIRDFLEIMGEIYDAYVSYHDLDIGDPSSLERFATSRTQIGDQSSKAECTQQVLLISTDQRRSEVDADVVARLVSGLGHYTAILQSNASDPRTLASAEREFS